MRSGGPRARARAISCPAADTWPSQAPTLATRSLAFGKHLFALFLSGVRLVFYVLGAAVVLKIFPW